MKKKISSRLNLLIEFWFAPLLRHCRTSFMNLTLVYLGMVLPLPFITLFLSLLALPCHLVPPPSSSFDSSMHLSPCSILSAAWPPPRSSLHPVASELMASRPWVTCIYPSHVLRPVYPYPPFPFGSRMPFQNLSSASSGYQEIHHFLGQVVLGISEGWLLGIPW